MSVHEQENKLIFESYLSKHKQLNEATYEDNGYKIKEFQTYSAWKNAVKKLNPSAKFTGDKDIDSCSCSECEAEWDGEKGTIQIKIKK